MKKTTKTNKVLLVTLATIACTTTLYATERPSVNLHQYKQQIVAYHQSGQYVKDLKIVTDNAKSYLSKRIHENNQLKHKKKLAIVLDIDETALSNYPGIKKMNFGGSDEQVNQQEAQANDPANVPVLDLYKAAIKNNVAVFFITGRTQKYYNQTAENLKKVGYTHWTKLYLKPNNYTKSSAIPYKQSLRRSIEKRGYDIILTMGDQYSDLKGGSADKTYKLPDYMYYIK